MTGPDWIGFALAVLLIELTPGPNMAWLASLALGDGRKAGLAATAGVALGLFVNALAAAFGLALIVANSGLVWQLLRWGGAACMLWLAWEGWHDARENSLGRVGALRAQRHFLSGLIVNVFNPKAMVFFVVILPRFNHGELPTFGQAIALAGLSIAIATAVHVAIVFAGSGLHRWLADPGKTRVVRRILALVLVGVAIWLAVGAQR